MSSVWTHKAARKKERRKQIVPGVVKLLNIVEMSLRERVSSFQISR